MNLLPLLCGMVLQLNRDCSFWTYSRCLLQALRVFQALGRCSSVCHAQVQASNEQVCSLF